MLKRPLPAGVFLCVSRVMVGLVFAQRKENFATRLVGG